MSRQRVMCCVAMSTALLLWGPMPRVVAEELSAQAMVSQHRVPLNGRIRLSLQVNGTQHVQPPDLQLEDFTSEYLGPSTQISVVNGQVSSAVTHLYALTPKRQGRCTIEPLRVEVDGKTLQTQPIDIDVVPPAAAGQSELVAKAVIGGKEIGLLYANGTYETADPLHPTLSASAVHAIRLITAITFTAVPIGSGARLAFDTNDSAN